MLYVTCTFFLKFYNHPIICCGIFHISPDRLWKSKSKDIFVSEYIKCSNNVWNTCVKLWTAKTDGQTTSNQLVHLVPLTVGRKAGALGPRRMSAFIHTGRLIPLLLFFDFWLSRSNDKPTDLRVLKSNFMPAGTQSINTCGMDT